MKKRYFFRHSQKKVGKLLKAINIFSNTVAFLVFLTKYVIVPVALLLWADNVLLRIAIIIFGIMAAVYEKTQIK